MKMTEIWKKIPAADWRYEVSNQGRVRSLDHYISQGNRWRSKTEYIRPGRILKPAKGTSGYLYALVSNKKRRILDGVHELVLLAFAGPRPKGFHATHLNGIKSDNRLSNLIWASPKENHSHKKIHGTNNHGEKNGQSKLKESQVLEIMSLRKKGLMFKDIAKKYRISPSHVRDIALRKRWKYLGALE